MTLLVRGPGIKERRSFSVEIKLRMDNSFSRCLASYSVYNSGHNLFQRARKTDSSAVNITGVRALNNSLGHQFRRTGVIVRLFRITNDTSSLADAFSSRTLAKHICYTQMLSPPCFGGLQFQGRTPSELD
ncbi:hypothetical protein ACF1BQ_027735 [Bradyrhizobium sp. RDT10]